MPQAYQLIEVAAQLKDVLQEMARLYTAFCAVINAEHNAILQGDLEQMHAAADQKTTAGDQIEHCFTNLQGVCRKIGQFQLIDEPVHTVSDALRALRSARGQDGLAGDVLRHQLDALEESWGTFQQSMSHVKPKLEMNRVVVAKILRNTQESIRFWSDIFADQQAAYDKSGKKPQKSTHKILQVKA
jgi:hypothetical protein